ncbi:hypothetical protein [Phenylobacterium montanum]|uniref:Uncharacterized protein n=1 Tax=Phenylobacterium montanum TaxID=2823693 RepID=A0A975G2J7_9CAUL|nr:hypothetical protein [Caulobacter sp. S6]QUD89322.1 hypothetical protein KCG34_05430 [Caulobacter sp. S6]
MAPLLDQDRLTPDEVRRICGDVLDWKVSAILALRPTASDVTVAVGWANRQDELGDEGLPLEGMAAQVYEVLTADEDFGDA